jgi:hypothetical protein
MLRYILATNFPWILSWDGEIVGDWGRGRVLAEFTGVPYIESAVDLSDNYEHKRNPSTETLIKV